MNELVDTYIKLRDAKSQLAKQHKEKVAKIDGMIDKIEAALLEQMNTLGVESVRTEQGTAYKSTLTSATVADWDACLDFIKQNEAWEMLEKRVKKDYVTHYVEEKGDLPPGVNIRTEVTVNVRRS